MNDVSRLLFIQPDAVQPYEAFHCRRPLGLSPAQRHPSFSCYIVSDAGLGRLARTVQRQVITNDAAMPLAFPHCHIQQAYNCAPSDLAKLCVAWHCFQHVAVGLKRRKVKVGSCSCPTTSQTNHGSFVVQRRNYAYYIHTLNQPCSRVMNRAL